MRSARRGHQCRAVLQAIGALGPNSRANQHNFIPGGAFPDDCCALIKVARTSMIWMQGGFGRTAVSSTNHINCELCSRLLKLWYAILSGPWMFMFSKWCRVIDGAVVINDLVHLVGREYGPRDVFFHGDTGDNNTCVQRPVARTHKALNRRAVSPSHVSGTSLHAICETTAYTVNFSRTCQQNGGTRQQHAGKPSSNQRVITYWPVGSTANRGPSATCSSQSDARPTSRDRPCTVIYNFSEAMKIPSPQLMECSVQRRVGCNHSERISKIRTTAGNTAILGFSGFSYFLTLLHCFNFLFRGVLKLGRGGVVVRPLASHLGEPGSIPGEVAPKFSCMTMPLVGGFYRGSPGSPAIAFRHYPMPTLFHQHRLSRPRCSVNLSTLLRKTNEKKMKKNFSSTASPIVLRGIEYAASAVIYVTVCTHPVLHPSYSQVRIVPDDAVGWRVFSGISRFPRSLIPALLHIHFNHPHRLLRPRC
ncbi:hypothetical protein PR048_007200 [Dryococelus australis]|uniref:Uncharacterized protein n=1 Tax=Dryococelus australis TaxID=614101 RepID=A0ABQ9ICY9_9NEOP|nr:hypothetical protein PR048_007200 [Dryococelus australis]